VTEPTYARRSARVLVLDGLGRALLLRHENGEWFTPGGGVEVGETRGTRRCGSCGRRSG
jgi:8-oxo-dGTP pyrophosphatase MutT (NUDIX family)